MALSIADHQSASFCSLKHHISVVWDIQIAEKDTEKKTDRYSEHLSSEIRIDLD